MDTFNSNGFRDRGNTPARVGWCERIGAAVPFLLVAVLATIGGGGIAAAMAHAPSREVLWAVAYLVLVVGVTQAALGIGQALLAKRETAVPVRMVEWVMFNFGSAGVIAGSLCSSRPLLLAGTLLFALALALFAWATRGARSNWLVHAYRALLVLIGGSAVVGLVLALVRQMS